MNKKKAENNKGDTGALWRNLKQLEKKQNKGHYDLKVTLLVFLLCTILENRQ